MKISRISVGCGLSFCAVFVWTSAVAHHSFSFFFDETQYLVIEGVVSEVRFVNPHVSVALDVTNEAGETEMWAVETNHRAGLQPEVAVGEPWLPDTLQPGDRLVIEGHPSKREGTTALHAFVLQRPTDGWQWVWRLPQDREEE